MPWLDYIWTKNPIVQRLQKTRANPVVGFAQARAQERQSQVVESYEGKAKLNSRDFLSRFLEALNKNPDVPRW